MAKLDQAQRREEQELAQLQEDLVYAVEPQSEPTTPPEYHEPTIPGFLTMPPSRPNRYSTSIILMPSANFSGGLSGGGILPTSQKTAPTLALEDDNGDDEEDGDDKELAVRQDPTSHRSTNR
jgi:hypothetical protein